MLRSAAFIKWKANSSLKQITLDSYGAEAGAARRKQMVHYLHGGKRCAVFADFLGIVICDLFDLKEPGCLRERLQSFFGVAALKILVLKPFFQEADVTPVLNHERATETSGSPYQASYIKDC